RAQAPRTAKPAGKPVAKRPTKPVGAAKPANAAGAPAGPKTAKTQRVAQPGAAGARPRKVNAAAQSQRGAQSARRAPASAQAARAQAAKNQQLRAENQARAKKSKRNKRIIIGVLVGIALIVGGALFYYMHLNNLMATRDEQLLASLKEQGSKDSFYMLLLGVDKGEERYATDGDDKSNYRSDTIILCRIAPGEVKATLISIHRDLMVTLQNGERGKINAAYSLGGPSGIVKAVSDLAGVDINHYVEIDFDSFMGIVDAVGGVEVTLPVNVYDPDFTGLNLPAGTHTLDGYDALMLCRSRHAYDAYGDGDLYRAANQRAVISAVLRKVLASDPSTMVAAVTSMAESVTTDLSLNDILTIAAQMRDFDTEKDLYTGMTPSEGELIDGVWYEILNKPAWTTMMQRVDKGLPPYESASADQTAGVAGTASTSGGITSPVGSGKSSSKSGSSSTSGKKNSDVVVTVMGLENGDPSFLVKELKSEGINAYASEAAEYAFDKSIVVYDDPAYEDEAALVATLLGYNYVLNDGSYYMPTGILVRVASGQNQGNGGGGTGYDTEYGTNEYVDYGTGYDSNDTTDYDAYGSNEYY
ncbi:MAG: LCP family protein, partial [Coriobacteriales bacterium]|nr:LCP family protein [Coriobacteriales bacterium]